MILCMDKVISWFEIPALDLGRARAFYETLFGVSLQDYKTDAQEMAIFPYNRETSTGGCLKKASAFEPSAIGTLVYLETGTELDTVLSRAAAHGGSVALPRTALPPGQGAYAHIIDTEGNRVGLHGTN
jgi:predicted enzyme related to lactoylglutathione lyase